MFLRIRNLFYRFLWFIRLRRKVNGRLKLCGNLKFLKISEGFSCDGDLWIGVYSDSGRIEIGENLSASGPLIITSIKSITIGKNLLLGPNVLICDHYHGDSKLNNFFDLKPLDRPLATKGGVVISDNVHIGFNVMVMSGTEIGFAAVIGANSVVIGTLNKKSIYAGSPAKLIRGEVNL